MNNDDQDYFDACARQLEEDAESYHEWLDQLNKQTMNGLENTVNPINPKKEEMI